MQRKRLADGSPSGLPYLCMKIVKRTFSSQLLGLLYQLRVYSHPKQLASSVFVRYWRRKSARREIFGIPVYVWNAHRDVMFGLELVEQALRLLGQTSPYSIQQIRKQFNCIIIVPGGGGRILCRAEKCCVINPFKYLPKADGNIKSANRQLLRLMASLASASQELQLFKRRFGYLGIKNSLYLKINTEIRVLRRCFSTEKQLEAFSVVAGRYKILDELNLRPGRRYHPYFIKREMEKWSCDRKLRLHPEQDTLVIEDQT
jgi:hypothetical protein